VVAPIVARNLSTCARLSAAGRKAMAALMMKACGAAT
jgi:hypothetical protein